MNKAQGSLEYLLILAAILAIAVVVVVVANSMIAAPEGQADLNKEKYQASIAGLEFVGYNTLYAGTVETAPVAITYKDTPYEVWGAEELEEGVDYATNKTLFVFRGYTVYLFEYSGGDYIAITQAQASTGSIFGNGMKSPSFGATAPGPSIPTPPNPWYITYYPHP